MAVKTARRTMPDTYFERIKTFPLTHIRDDAHMDQAHRVIDGMLQEKLDKGEQEYLDALSDLVEVYEGDHHPVADASEADVLRELMAANRLSQPKLAKAVGISQSTVSSVLRGSRTLTKDQVLKLAKFFSVPPAVFFPS